jgi:NitT/TauT family transport system permease protein
MTVQDAATMKPDEQAENRTSERRRRWLRSIQPIAAAALVLAIWQAIIVLFDVPKYIVPSPTDIIEAGIKKAPIIGRHYLVTLYEALFGYTIAVLIAVPSALLIAYSKFAQRTIYPTMALMDMIPKIALAPVFIVWLGLGLAPKLAVTALVCFFPIVLNGILGFRSINPEIIYLAQSMGSRPWETFWKIRFPNALPYLFVGLKYGASAAMVGAVVAEFVGGNAGLGYYLVDAMAKYKTGLGFAIMFAMTTIGLGLFFGMQIVERLAVPWHVSQRTERQGAVRG